MTPKSFITGFSGDTDIAGTLAIAAPRALYEVAFGSKPKKNPTELLPPSAADCACGIRLEKIEDEKTGIINRSHGSTYLDEKSVLTSGATPCGAFNRFLVSPQSVPDPQTRKNLLALLLAAKTAGLTLQVRYDPDGGHCDQGMISVFFIVIL
jgi:hypothetical protein